MLGCTAAATAAACSLNVENISQETSGKIKEMMPSNLMKHEWHKHGTCTGLTQEEYFNTTVGVQKLYQTPDIIKYHIGNSVDYNSIAEAFGGDDMVNIFCKTKSNKQYFEQIHHFLDKELRPIRKKYHSTTCKKEKRIYVK